MRRYADYLMILVEAHAVLHQATRERDEDGWIVATTVDYRAVYPLVCDLFGEAAEVSVSKTLRETVEAAQKIIDMNLPLTRGPLAEKLQITPQACGRRLTEAMRAGYLKPDPDAADKRTRVFVMGDEKLPENNSAIPHPDEIEDAFDPPPENTKTRNLKNRGEGVEDDSGENEGQEKRNQKRNLPETRNVRFSEEEREENKKDDTYADPVDSEEAENGNTTDPLNTGFAFSYLHSSHNGNRENRKRNQSEPDTKPGEVSRFDNETPLSSDLPSGSSGFLSDLKEKRNGKRWKGTI